jgi:hypothetical protein
MHLLFHRKKGRRQRDGIVKGNERIQRISNKFFRVEFQRDFPLRDVIIYFRGGSFENYSCTELNWLRVSIQLWTLIIMVIKTAGFNNNELSLRHEQLSIAQLRTCTTKYVR